MRKRQRKRTAKKKTAKATATRKDTFSPTPEDRRRVAAMIGAGVNSDTIRKIVLNPKTSRPIARSTFWLRFAAELDEGTAMTSGEAAATLVEAMRERRKDGTIPRVAVTAAIFWLKTRESELFSERRVNENIDRQAASELGKIDRPGSTRIAELVLKQNKAEELLEKTGGVSINDDPKGSA